MSITKQIKEDIIKKFALSSKDTGSSEIQIALFTQHISNLTEHLKINKKDFQARKGLIAFVERRKKLLKYMKKSNHTSYEKIINELKIKKV